MEASSGSDGHRVPESRLRVGAHPYRPGFFPRRARVAGPSPPLLQAL